MCSIIGFNKENKDDLINKMNETIKHRGPNLEGYYLDDNISLAFRNLLEGRNQEDLFNEDKTLTAMIDGVLYNYKELKEKLEKKGYRFQTSCQAELLIHGYEEYQENFFNKLKGMFSFVIYNIKDKELIIVRDHFGIKPLYYYKKGNVFMFASEIKAFLKHPLFIKKLKIKQLELYLSFQHSPSPNTFFKNVYKLKPGNYLTLKENKIEIKSYNTFKLKEDNNNLNYYIKGITKTLSKAINNQIDKTNIIGSYLSSGVDSSYITKMGNIKNTFSVGFKEGKYDEVLMAKEFAESLNLNNKSQYITKDEFFKVFPKVQYHMDEPLADAAAIPLYIASNLASNYVDIIFSGEGADELYGGYHLYKEPYSGGIYIRIPFFIRQLISKLIMLLPDRKGLNFLKRKGTKLEDRYIGNANIFKPKEIKKLLNKKKLKHTYKDITNKYYKETKSYDQCQKMQYIDLNIWLVDDILLKADKVNMANSLEVRMPFLDKEVMAFAATIPTKYKLNKKETKYVFRKVANLALKHKVANREKLGFPVPLALWIKEKNTYHQIKKKFENNPFFNKKRSLKLLEDHYHGKKDNWRKIWTLYTFLVWHEIYFEKNTFDIS